MKFYSEKENETQPLPDLPLSDENSDETKAGADRPVGSFLAFPGFNGGVFVGSGD